MDLDNSTKKSNRRSSPRRPPKASSRIECRKGSIGLGTNVAETLLDISETGARMIVKSVLEQGDEVELILLGQGQARQMKVLADVVWVVRGKGDCSCIGLQFRHRLRYSEFQHLT